MDSWRQLQTGPNLSGNFCRCRRRSHHHCRQESLWKDSATAIPLPLPPKNSLERPATATAARGVSSFGEPCRCRRRQGSFLKGLAAATAARDHSVMPLPPPLLLPPPQVSFSETPGGSGSGMPILPGVSLERPCRGRRRCRCHRSNPVKLLAAVPAASAAAAADTAAQVRPRME